MTMQVKILIRVKKKWKQPARQMCTSFVNGRKIICMVKKKKAIYDKSSQEFSPGCRQTCFLVNDPEKTP